MVKVTGDSEVGVVSVTADNVGGRGQHHSWQCGGVVSITADSVGGVVNITADSWGAIAT